MRILQFSKTLSHSLLLSAVALLSHAGTALAVDTASDPQALARELLAPSTLGASRAVQVNSLPQVGKSVGDAQQQARRLLSGPRDAAARAASPQSSSTLKPQTTAQSDRRTDTQKLAQRMILGEKA